MKNVLFIIVFLAGYNGIIYAQTENDTIDYKYREDQLYASITYNILRNKQYLESKSFFSGGFSLGFIKDIPLNENRNFGFGVGLGYVFNSYNKQFTLNSSSNDLNVGKVVYELDKFTTNLVEVPFEIRWRTSTPSKYKFWRVYGGFKFSYLLSSKIKVKSDTGMINIKNISQFNKYQYGLILSAGYGNWNIFTYYGLSPIFNEVMLDNGKTLNLKDFNLGFKFYIL